MSGRPNVTFFPNRPKPGTPVMPSEQMGGLTAYERQALQIYQARYPGKPIPPHLQAKMGDTQAQVEEPKDYNIQEIAAYVSQQDTITSKELCEVFALKPKHASQAMGELFNLGLVGESEPLKPRKVIHTTLKEIVENTAPDSGSMEVIDVGE